MINGWQDPNHFIDEDDAPCMPDVAPDVAQTGKSNTAWVCWAFMLIVILLAIFKMASK